MDQFCIVVRLWWFENICFRALSFCNSSDSCLPRIFLMVFHEEWNVSLHPIVESSCCLCLCGSWDLRALFFVFGQLRVTFICRILLVKSIELCRRSAAALWSHPKCNLFKEMEMSLLKEANISNLNRQKYHIRIVQSNLDWKVLYSCKQLKTSKLSLKSGFLLFSN